MESTELRIRNWVYIPQYKQNKQIGAIYENGSFMTLNYENSFSSINCATPIPLTEEILLKCGFIKCEDFDEGGLIDYRYELHLFNGSISFTSNWSTEDSIYVNLNQCGTDVFYLHQLQNLYHALTGEELTVNL